MPVSNPVQFAVVREDPAVERAVLAELGGGPRSALLVASGGCTALTLAAECPEVRVVAIDPNPAQLDLVRRKVAALAARDREAFGVGRDDPRSLTGCGNFESLFRGLRAVLDDLVLPYEDRLRLLVEGGDPTPLVGNAYWPVAFRMFFSDSMLEAMFGRDATQHAAPGSYPAYFQGVIERGLARPDAAQNRWLHHVLLGHWLPGSAPRFLEAPALRAFDLVQASFATAPSFADFDLVSLSNVFDWMGDAAIDEVVARLRRECRPGARIVIRQLNNRAPVEARFAGAFHFDPALAARLHDADQSLFYERLLVGERMHDR